MSAFVLRRSLLRLAVVLQVILLVTSLVAPVAALAEEPSADPSPTPTPSAEPSAEPTPEPSAEPTPQATAEPTPEATVEPTAEPTAEPDPTATPATPAPSAEPTPEPTPTAPAAAPTISSDQADYPPGAVVTLAGSNWQPGEYVHVYVNDDVGSTWNRHADLVADAGGRITDQFTLPDWFVATYRVTAGGSVSGTATTTFTDGNFRVKSNSASVFFSLTWTEHINNLS